jgi:serine/threonine-protein kinase
LPTPGERFTAALVTVAMVGLIVACLLVARMNLRAGRGDRTGARRLATAVFLTQMLAWLLTATHLPKPMWEMERFFAATGRTLFYVALAWMLYVALEPWVRRFWPDSLMGWTRLFSGAVRDPRVGRDLLVGAAFGIAVQGGFALLRPLQRWLGHDLPAVSPSNIEFYRGPHMVFGMGLEFVFGAAFNAMVLIFTIVGLKVLLGRAWLAWLGTVLFYVALTVPAYLASPGLRWLNVVGAVVTVAALPTVAIRFGLLAAVCAFFFSYALSAVPWTWTFSSWAFNQSALTFVLLSALLVFGGWAAAWGRDGRLALAPR